MRFPLASLILFLFHTQVLCSSSFAYPQCSSDESSALFHFRYSFPFDTRRWDESTNCCSWREVTCESVTGHVIGLNLRSDILRGALNSNSSLFSLRYLRILDLSSNDFLGSNIPPNFGDFKDLTHLDLSYSNFSGLIPFEITRLQKLVSFRLRSYSEEIKMSPATFKTLAQNWTKLRDLDLRGIDMSLVPSSLLRNLSFSLTYLDLSWCNLHGEIPDLDLSSNNLMVGQIPSKLTFINLSNNLLNGKLPAWIYSGSNLEWLDLSSNSYTGEIGVEELSNSIHLVSLRLSDTNIGLRFNQSASYSFNSLSYLGLSSCNITVFPNFIRSSKSLLSLDLSQNQLHGSVPKWLGDFNHLERLNLSDNFLTHIDPLTRINSLATLDLRSNSFSGPLPIILSSRLWLFLVSKNRFSGEIPYSICGLTSLQMLDFSFNYLSGEIPQCMGNFSQKLSVFDLRNNKLKGTIPTTFSLISLRTLNLNGNQLEAQLPTSLENCTNLEVHDLWNNLFQGTFPYWLGSLPDLKVLVLRSNKFRGSIPNPRTKSPFQKLRIMDFSNNEFTGSLPRKLFGNFEAIINSDEETVRYMGDNYYQDFVMVNLKGSYMELERILTIFTTIDFSRNNFSSVIPESIRRLKALKGLNFSHNKLTGGIPWSLSNLTNLEALDLSSNELVGEIHVDLVDLTSLAFLNLSHNHLEGPIPQGKQFSTFSNDSYIGNVGLCGFPMTQKCIEDSDEESTSPSQNRDVELNWFEWKTVAMGYGSGLVIGISLGYMLLYSNGRLSWTSEKIIFRILKR